MSGSAYLAPGNDVCLATGAMVTITGPLTAREPQWSLFEITLNPAPASGASVQVLISDPTGYESEFAQFECMTYPVDSNGFVNIP